MSDTMVLKIDTVPRIEYKSTDKFTGHLVTMYGGIPLSFKEQFFEKKSIRLIRVIHFTRLHQTFPAIFKELGQGALIEATKFKLKERPEKEMDELILHSFRVHWRGISNPIFGGYE